jgi:acetyl esterase/lipase
MTVNSVPVKAHVFPGLPHGFLRFDELPSSQRWDELIVTSIDWSLSYPEKAVLESEISIQVE